MEQTVVEYLVKELNEKAIIGGTIDRVLMNNIIEKAKEIEKQQMVEMHDKGFDFALKECEELNK